MAKQPRQPKPESKVPTEHEEQAPHPLGLDGDSPNEISDEDYWAREQEYQDVFAVFQTMFENAMNVGVRWNDIGNFAQDPVYRHAMSQPHDEALEESLWIAAKNCASLMHMLAEHGKQVVRRELHGNTLFILRDSRTGKDVMVWDEVEERPSPPAD